jgi:CheY-like chemotaxis protein
MQTPVEISAKILLAEDDNDMRRFLVKALQNAGYEVTSFDNGLSAYNRLREEPFELLLTDIVMPEMDGIELARRSIPPTRLQRTPASSPSPFIFEIWLTKWSGCSKRLDTRLPSLAKTARGFPSKEARPRTSLRVPVLSTV